MTPLDMVLIRECLPGMPGNAFLAESKLLRSIDVKGAGRWGLGRRTGEASDILHRILPGCTDELAAR